MRYYLHHTIDILEQALTLGIPLTALAFLTLTLIYRRQEKTPHRTDYLYTAAASIYTTALIAYTFLPLESPTTFICTSTNNYYPRFSLGWSWSFALRDAGGNWLDALTSMYVLQLLLNVLLFIPLGLLLRYRWSIGFTAALYISFGVSLTIELTQLTGFWGLYGCSVRTFDVEDLLANTVGGVLGWAALALWRNRSRD